MLAPAGPPTTYSTRCSSRKKWGNEAWKLVAMQSSWEATMYVGALLLSVACSLTKWQHLTFCQMTTIPHRASSSVEVSFGCDAVAIHCALLRNFQETQLQQQRQLYWAPLRNFKHSLWWTNRGGWAHWRKRQRGLVQTRQRPLIPKVAPPDLFMGLLNLCRRQHAHHRITSFDVNDYASLSSREIKERNENTMSILSSLTTANRRRTTARLPYGVRY
jgi:hypothetical protein